MIYILYQYQALQKVMDDEESALNIAADVLVGAQLTRQERINRQPR